MILAGLGLVGLAAVVSYWVAYRLARTPNFGAVDHPGERTLHATPTPRTGGVAILSTLMGAVVIAFTLAWLVGRPPLESSGLGIVLLVTAVLAAHAYWNDLNETTVLTRLGVQAVAATLVVLGARLTLDPAGLPLGRLALPVTVLALVWMTNLYNFMDGMDGFAGGMTIVGFAALAGFSFRGSRPVIGWFALLVVGATAGFLVHNFPPGRIFLGDVGSVPLGFLAGSLSLLGIRDRLFDVWVPVLIFSPFVVDATATLVRRLLRGERVWRPHREHYYQRLVLAGWGHRRTVLAEYALMVASGVTAAAYVLVSEAIQVCLLSLWAGIYCACMYAVRTLETGRSGCP
jgi:UDP-N-acetylmuramyl pentapeptide phosphotransferase/UDP-N-acetylglucosamine-1-phosphate transferase